MSLDACLPANLRGPATTITPIAAGLSGAGVYRVEAAGKTFVLKVSREDEPAQTWGHRIRIHQLSADAGVAPPVVHVDEAQRAVLTQFVADRSFIALYSNPATRQDALALVGRTVRRVHAIAAPPGTPVTDPQTFLAGIWEEIGSDVVMPAFVQDAVGRMLVKEVSEREPARVLSHNDVNPTNLLYDGEHLLLLDWDTAGLNDRYYDLATVSVFLRLDETACRTLLAAYDGEPVATVPERFAYNRRMAAVLCGSIFFRLARGGGHPGPSGDETFETTPSLSTVYQQFRAGSLSVATTSGQWAFGLALLRESLTS